MKVLQINTTVNTGSTGRIVEEIGQALQKYGYKSFIAYKNAGPKGSSSNLIDIGNKFDVCMHGVKTRIFDRHGFGSKSATQDLVCEVERIDPDIIGLHNLHGYYLNIEILFDYLKKVQKPLVWTLHDCWPFTGHCSYFDYVGCDKWKTECHNCPISDKYPASWFVDNSIENFYQKKELFNGLENLTIVTPSHWLKELVGQSFLSSYPVEVIHNGIDLDQFTPLKSHDIKSKYNLSDKKLLLGVASVWDRRKGLKYFIELSKQLDDSFRTILIGLSEERIKELPENIIGIPRTENIDELVAFYNVADVFVNPTLVDNFPTTNLEALACGTPVITFDTGGSPEAIDEKTGLVVDKKDVDQLSQAILQITESSQNGYADSCRNRSIRYFNKEDRYEEYLNLYHKIVDRVDA
jgi:glycosyltransferase involved in cell wall biosynthesis